MQQGPSGVVGKGRESVPGVIRAMIVDDHAIVRQGVRRVLGAAGDIDVVAEAGGYRDALETIRSVDCDVLVTDVSLPGRSGLELLADVRRERPTLQVIVLSVHPPDQIADAALRNGAYAYLTKDVVGEELVAAVRSAAYDRADSGEMRAHPDPVANAPAAMPLLLAKADPGRPALLESVLEHVADGVVVADERGRFLVFNAAAERLLGVGAIDSPTSEWSRRYGFFRTDRETHVPEAELPLVKAIRGEATEDVPLFVRNSRRPTGAFVSMSGRALRGAGGEHIGGVVVFQDITERRRVEAQLRDQERFLSAVLDTVGIGIVACDADGVLTLFNRTTVELHGLPQETLPAEDWADYYDLYQQDGETRMKRDEVPLFRALRGEVVDDVEMVIKPKDLPPRIVLATGRVIVDAEGRKLGAVAAMHDVTERRKTDEQLRQAQKLEAVGRLAGGVAHDFNNVLGVITGYSELLLRRLEDGAHRKKLEQIHKAAERGGALTRQLLAFSRRQVLQPTVVDLNAVVADIEPMLTRLIGENIEVALRLSDESQHVKVDRTQIEQAIMNLAVNARDAMPGGGRLLVETAHTDLDESYARRHPEVEPGRYASLVVSDTGEGMDEATLGSIFDPFFTTKEAGKGTGLGLAIVHGVIKQSSGHVSVHSAAGRGTTFKLHFPAVAPSAASGERPTRVAAARGGSETILLVEDNRALRAVTAETLQDAGYVVLSAPDASAAEAVAGSTLDPIHLLLTDVVMPGATGAELARRLADRHAELSVLFMSGYTADAIGQHGVLDEDVHFIEKPFSSKVLLEKIRDVLDSTTRRGA